MVLRQEIALSLLISITDLNRPVDLIALYPLYYRIAVPGPKINSYRPFFKRNFYLMMKLTTSLN